MKASGSLSDIAGSVKGYLKKKQQRQSLTSELWQYAQWLPLALAARALGYHRLGFLFGTWFGLGTMTVVYMRQNALNVTWWHALLVAAVLMFGFARELALPDNAFWLFFARYVVGATAATAVLGRVLPAHLLAEMPPVLFRVGILRAPADEAVAAAAPRRSARAKAQ